MDVLGEECWLWFAEGGEECYWMGVGVVVVGLCARSWGFWLVVCGLVKRGGLRAW